MVGRCGSNASGRRASEEEPASAASKEDTASVQLKGEPFWSQKPSIYGIIKSFFQGHDCLAARGVELVQGLVQKFKTLIPYAFFIVSLCVFPADLSRSVRVGVFPAAPLVDAGQGDPQGFFIDIIDYIAQENAWTLSYVQGTWQDLLAKLESGDIDLLPAVGYIDSRKSIFDFSRQSVFIDSGVVYTGENTELKDIFYIEGKKVAAVNGSTFTDGFLEYMRSFNIGCEMVLVENNLQVMEMIASGEVFAGVTIYSLGIELAKNYPVTVTPISFSPIALHYAVPKNKNADILAVVNSSLNAIKNDPLSIYHESYKKWIYPETPAAIPKAFIVISAIIGVLAVGFGGLSIILRKEVDRKTRYLVNEIQEHKKVQENLYRSLQTNETLLKELYHRTKNTLQMIRSFLSLEAAELHPNSGIELLVSKTNDRIDSISLVHEMLYQEQNLSNLSLKAYIEKLLNQLSANSGFSTACITLDLAIEDKLMEIEQVIPLGLVINELYTNSLKYAFPDHGAGRVSLHIQFRDDGELVLEYSDDGVGFPDDVDIQHPETLGLKLVYLIAEAQLHGKVRIERGNGVMIKIQLPLSSP